MLLTLLFVSVVFDKLRVKFVNQENKFLAALNVSNTILVEPDFDF